MLLRHIRYLLAVAEHENFTRAAQSLHVSQPALSQQVRQLEEMLGAQLLDRSGRSVRLTDAGEAYVRFARSALQDLDAGKRAIHDVHDLSRGSLRIGMTPTFAPYLIGPLVKDFNARYPGITLEIDEMSQDRMEALLGKDEIDIGIAFAAARAADIESQALFVETLGLVVGEAHPWAGKQGVLGSRELAQESLVLLNGDFATRRHIDAYCQKNGIELHVAIESNSVGVIIEIVRHSTLATVLPEAIACEQPGLFPVALRHGMPPRTVMLLQRQDAYRSAACGAFAALAREHGQQG